MTSKGMSSFRSRKRRHLNGKDVQPVKQVAAERTRCDRGLQVAIGGGDHPHIGPNGSGSSDALKFAFLKNPQKSDLSFRREVLQLRRGRSCLSRPVQSVLNDAALLP